MNQERVISDTKGRDDRVMQMNLAALEEGAKAAKAPVKPAGGMKGPLTLDQMLDVPVALVFEVGRTSISMRQLLEMNRGSFIELRNVSVDSIDVRINEAIVANGEAIALKQQYGVRIREVLPLAVVNEYEFQNG